MHYPSRQNSVVKNVFNIFLLCHGTCHVCIWFDDTCHRHYPIHTGLGKNAVKGGPIKVKVSYQITKRDNEFPPTLQPELTSHDKVHKGTNKENFQICKTEVWLFGLTALRCYRKRTCARDTYNILHAN